MKNKVIIITPAQKGFYVYNSTDLPTEDSLNDMIAEGNAIYYSFHEITDACIDTTPAPNNKAYCNIEEWLTDSDNIGKYLIIPYYCQIFDPKNTTTNKTINNTTTNKKKFLL